MNLELHDALAKQRESGPFILVGHGFGGPVARNYALKYPREVVGIVFVNGMSEDQRFEMWHRAVLMRDGAKGKAIPAPHEQLRSDDRLPPSPYYDAKRSAVLDPPFDRLQPELRAVHLWAQTPPSLAPTEQDERNWSPEYFERWHDHPDEARLGSIPLIVLTREHGEYHDLDISANQQEAERQENQRRLAALSANADQRIVACGEHIEIEAPETIVRAVQDVRTPARGHSVLRVGEIQRREEVHVPSSPRLKTWAVRRSFVSSP